MSIYFYFFWILLDSSQATEHVHCLPNFTYDTFFMFMLLKSCMLYQPQLSNIALQQYLECSTNKQLSPGIKRKKSSSFHQLWERLYGDQLHSAKLVTPFWLSHQTYLAVQNYFYQLPGLSLPCKAKPQNNSREGPQLELSCILKNHQSTYFTHA